METRNFPVTDNEVFPFIVNIRRSCLPSSRFAHLVYHIVREFPRIFLRMAVPAVRFERCTIPREDSPLPFTRSISWFACKNWKRILVGSYCARTLSKRNKDKSNVNYRDLKFVQAD